MKTLVEQLQQNEIGVKIDCTPDEMLEILSFAFPKSYGLTLDKINRWCFKNPNTVCVMASRVFKNDWIQMFERDGYRKPSVSAKEFLVEIRSVKKQ